jgi:hypothetical protein
LPLSAQNSGELGLELHDALGNLGGTLKLLKGRSVGGHLQRNRQVLRHWVWLLFNK